MALTEEYIEEQIKAGRPKKELIALVRDEAQRERDTDPYYFFQPTIGEVSKEKLELLREYIKEDDIPLKFDGQLDVFKSNADILIVLGGNRSGKTVVEIIIDFIIVTGIVPKSLEGIFPLDRIPKKTPRFVRVTGIDEKQIENAVIKEYKKWCPKQCLKNRKWEDSFSEKKKTLTLYNRNNNTIFGTIEFRTNEQEVASFQGVVLHKNSYDEEPKEEIRKENLARLLTADRIQELFAFTPTKGLSWSTKLLDGEEGEDGRSVGIFKLAAITNPMVKTETLRQVLKEYDKNDPQDYEVLKMRLLGDFVSLSGRVYGNLYQPVIHLIKPFKLNPRDYVVYRGLDPHTSKPTVCVEVAINRDGYECVVGVYKRACDTAEVKRDLADRAKERKYRLAQTMCDKSADTTNQLLGGRNIFKELSQGIDAIPAMVPSEKFTGSIHAGVDTIKQLLKINPITQRPGIRIFDTPETRELQAAFKYMERETYANEDSKGMKDAIAEGKWDDHAALRYIHQKRIRFIPFMDPTPQMVEEERYV